MVVLGIGGFMHDYNCAIIDLKKKRVAMFEAERISRRKHHVIRKEDDMLAPIRQCCDTLDIALRHIDVVVFGHTDPFPCREWIKERLGRGKKYIDVDHHHCHAAGAFFASGLESAAIVTLDGFGDGASGILAHGRGKSIDVLERLSDQDSIGLEYTRATYHLGLGGYGAEGKTQGLAPYGEPTLFDRYMEQIEILPSGQMRLGEALRTQASRLAVEGGYLNAQLLNNDFLDEQLPRRIDPEPITRDHMNLAASIQKTLETVAGRLCTIARQRTGEADLVLGGGVTMNSSLNGKLLEQGFRRIFPLPMASDRGIGLGAALYYVHQVLGEERFFKLDSVFHGQAFADKAGESAMRRAGLRVVKGEDVIEIAARALAEGKIIGWFQGRSEMGARALGNRSILADPRQADMKDIINARVKHREWFRPFAPVALAGDAPGYFDYPPEVADLDFMTFTTPARQAAREACPAVVHVDGTARLQVLRATDDRPYARLIRRFGALTGVPVLLNTSFNDQGEPIVEAPEEAVQTFLKADMDLLCIGNLLGYKS
ncbi:MAG: carbamoyl transferase [Magnetococcales bacterium]|nr:carbamoyl transferase [Magnetococcales bacterium]